MSIRKDVTVKITNNNATLDMPLQIYELDHGIELRFKLMDYKYKYTKDPQNILNSSDEDILEAYTTIINPRGYELQQINGEVKDDIVIFMIDSSYTDEIDEIGTYSLQIHIKCACSEFSIPPIQFEVLQRLKGVKVVTDGEDSIDDSALIDNYSNFISDETGKLLIEWKKGDIISSVKLNAMVEVINNAVDEEAQRQLNEVKREQQELERQNKVREALNSVDARVDEAMIEYETRFNALTVSQQQDMEVIDARDGEVSLKARLDRDLRNPLQVYEDVEGSYISCDSIEGYLKNVEILGNTLQDQNDLADIRSVGDKLGNQELYEIPVLCTNGLDSSDSNYKEHKLTILSPVQLEKVGDVADRIVEKDGVWGVEKIINTFKITGNETWGMNYGALTEETRINTRQFYTNSYDNINLLPGSKHICNKFNYGAPIYDTDAEGISITSSGNNRLRIGHTSKSVDKFKEWLRVNDVFVKYATTQPTFIPLPHDQQIKLRTFANKTNIHFECEIEPTLKASVPKSLGATVSTHTEQIDNLGKELDKVKKLEESAVSTVTTESDFTTVENTSNGYFEDVKLEGKTLVNLIDKPLRTNSTINGGDSQSVIGNNSFEYTVVDQDTIAYFIFNLSKTIELDKQYTIFYTIDENSISSSESNYGLYVDSVYGSFPSVTISGGKLNGKIGLYSLPLHTPSSQTSNPAKYMNQLSLGIHKSAVGGKLKVSNIMLLEGDHTQNPPEFFEGLKSIGQDVDEISVVSVKGDGNLCEGNELNISIKNGVSGEFSKGIAFRPTSDLVAYFVDCEGGQLNTANVAFMFLDKSKNTLGRPNYTPTNLRNYNFKFSDRGIKYSDVYYVKMFWNDKVGKDVMISNLTFISGNIAPTKHITRQQNKKRILYYNDETQAWEKPILRQWDSIEKHSDDKYYYHKRSGEVVLIGSENSWAISGVNHDDKDILRFYVKANAKPTGGNNIKGNVISDKFNSNSYDSVFDLNIEGIAVAGDGSIGISILKSKLSSKDVQGFKAWLQANNVTVVYQLAEEKVYECTNLDLIAYENETNFIVNAGAIAPVSTLKVMCNINNVVRELQQKVSNLENYIQHVMIDALNNALNE